MISIIIQECTQCLMSKEEEVTNSAQECLGDFWDEGTCEPYFEKKKKNFVGTGPMKKKAMHFKHFF